MKLMLDIVDCRLHCDLSQHLLPFKHIISPVPNQYPYKNPYLSRKSRHQNYTKTMPSSEALADNGGESISAKSSLKRSRILYAVNPQTAFIPTIDPVILQQSIDRRKRKITHQQIDHRPNTGANGMLAIEGDSSSASSRLEMKPVTSSALTIQNNSTTSAETKTKKLSNDNSGGGILVVSLDYPCFSYPFGYTLKEIVYHMTNSVLTS